MFTNRMLGKPKEHLRCHLRRVTREQQERPVSSLLGRDGPSVVFEVVWPVEGPLTGLVGRLASALSLAEHSSETRKELLGKHAFSDAAFEKGQEFRFR